MRRSKVKDLLARPAAGGDVLVQGWVKTKRASKSVSFVHVSDGSTLADIQVVADEGLDCYDVVQSLNTGCSVSVVGALVESPGKGQKYEIQAKRIDLIGAADPRILSPAEEAAPRLSSYGRLPTSGPGQIRSALWPGSGTPSHLPYTDSSKNGAFNTFRPQSLRPATPREPGPCSGSRPWTWTILP